MHNFYAILFRFDFVKFISGIFDNFSETGRKNSHLNKFKFKMFNYGHLDYFLSFRPDICNNGTDIFFIKTFLF